MLITDACWCLRFSDFRFALDNLTYHVSILRSLLSQYFLEDFCRWLRGFPWMILSQEHPCCFCTFQRIALEEVEVAHVALIIIVWLPLLSALGLLWFTNLDSAVWVSHGSWRHMITGSNWLLIWVYLTYGFEVWNSIHWEQFLLLLLILLLFVSFFLVFFSFVCFCSVYGCVP